MPLSEVHQTRKVDTNQSKMTNCSSDLSSFMPDGEFVELLWENGQIVLHGQPNKPRKSPTFSHTGRAQEKDNRDAVISKIGQLEDMDPLLNDLSSSESSGNAGLNAQDDDMVPWINYPIEDSLQNDYFSEFMSEFPEVNLNSLSTETNNLPTDRRTGFTQTVRSLRNAEHGHTSKSLAGGSDPNRIRTSQSFQLSQQCQSLAPSTDSRVTDMTTSGSSSTHQGLDGDFQASRLPKQDLASSRLSQSSSSMGLVNFSHFSRPVTLAKANLQSVDRLRSNEKASTTTTTSSNPMESTVINSAGGLKTISGTQGLASAAAPKIELRPSTKPPQELVSVEQSDGNHSGNVNNNGSILPDCNNLQSSNFALATMPSGRNETERGPETVVASSSLCSRNSAGAASNDPKQRAKRKTHEGEESGHQSEELEDEPEGLKKPATMRGTSTKRSRAAEVHNLSERRRRDRINEKMRALQELIPNCNKVDKASMLDEAIEYLKTLQVQVQSLTQIMSMGSGLCMPPMILPAGMQHMLMPLMAHLSQMGVGMGMGMRLGYGMGMLDTNGSPSCPLLPVPPMRGPQLCFPSIPGTQGLHGMPSSTSLPTFGTSGLRLPAPMPPIPPFGSLSVLSEKPNLMPEAEGMTNNPLPATDAIPSSSSKDQQQQILDLENMQKTSTEGSQIKTSTQEAKVSFKKSTLVQMSNQTLHVTGNGVQAKKRLQSSEQLALAD